MSTIEAWTMSRGVSTMCNNLGKETREAENTTYKCKYYKPALYSEKPRCMFYRTETEMCDKLEEKK